MYHAKIEEGHEYKKLKPVISIWLLVGDMPAMPVRLAGFPEIPRPEGEGETGVEPDYQERRKTDLLHVPFAIYSREAGLYLTDHFAIRAAERLRPGVTRSAFSNVALG